MGSKTGAEAGSVIEVGETARGWNLLELPIPTRLLTVLYRCGFRSVGDLHGASIERIARSPGCGDKTLVELDRFLNALREGRLQPLSSPNSYKERQPTISVPQGAMRWPLVQLPISARLAGVLKDLGFTILGDLHGFPIDKMLVLKNCGSRTIAELRELVRRVQEGEFDYVVGEDHERNLAHLLVGIDEMMDKLPRSRRDMLSLRFGGTDCMPFTLKQIGAKYGITPERVRQILNKSVEKIHRSGGPLFDELIKRVAERFLTSVCPLTAQILTHWFGGNSSVCRFSPSFYVRLLAAVSAAVPARPNGHEPDRASERQSRISRSLRKYGWTPKMSQNPIHEPRLGDGHGFSRATKAGSKKGL